MKRFSPCRAFRRWRKALFTSMLLWSCCLAAACGEDVVMRTGARRLRVDIGYAVRTTTLTPDSMAVTLPLPLAEHYQEVAWETEPPGLTYRYPETGDDYLLLRFRRRYLGGEREYDAGYSFDVVVSGLETDFSRIGETYPYRQGDASYRKYTGYNGEFIAPKHGRVARAAGEIGNRGGNVEYARRAFEYVTKRFRLKPENGLKPLEKVFADGGGSGVNVCSLFVSLLRHRGIPARHVAGFGVGGGERVYVEFYLEGYGWIPADVVRTLEGRARDGFGRIAPGDAVIVMSRDIDLTVKTLNEDEKVPLMTRGLLRWSRRHAPSGMKVRGEFFFEAR